MNDTDLAIRENRERITDSEKLIPTDERYQALRMERATLFQARALEDLTAILDAASTGDNWFRVHVLTPGEQL